VLSSQLSLLILFIYIFGGIVLLYRKPRDTDMI